MLPPLRTVALLALLACAAAVGNRHLSDTSSGGCGSLALRVSSSLNLCNVRMDFKFSDGRKTEYLLQHGETQDQTVTPYCSDTTSITSIEARTVGSGTFGCGPPVPPETQCQGWQPSNKGPPVNLGNKLAFNVYNTSGNGCIVVLG